MQTLTHTYTHSFNECRYVRVCREWAMKRPMTRRAQRTKGQRT